MEITTLDMWVGLVAVTSVIYLGRVFNIKTQLDEKKKAGETPLYFKTYLAMLIAFLAEINSAWGIIWLGNIVLDMNLFWLFVVIFIATLVKDIVGYGVMRTYWALVVKANEKAFKESLKRDIRKMGGEA
ncbi:hypothetical protein BPS13_0167 [Bacillus phage BPS13]|uniref:Uncharacterized protein n=1 Tax=Bacillus phage BPS13 TaxID=1136731 RepID=J9PUI2_9CAUD|nr:hypothetical protein [Bacillus thuringiensis]YP_006907726.1 hypothetical protein BPS13_0167 [Bacillus phage BPS13]AEZ50346.1 hypothetical protein BPS13_0167 [Bacillus phage BPS13]OTZ47855.1 hypothetical protein BK762_19405 [Bacillus thuringiensis serovar toumanoffi]